MLTCVRPANLVALLQYLGLAVTSTQLDFSWSSGGSDSLQWSVGLLKDIIASTKKAVWSQEVCQILFDRIRFKYLSSDVFPDGLYGRSCTPDSSLSVDEYLTREGFSTSFRDKYLTPLVSAFWQTDAGRFLSSFPVVSLVGSLYHSRLLFVHKSAPEWKRVNRGAHKFVQALSSDFPDRNVHLGCRVLEICNAGGGQFALVTHDGQRELFDHVVLAVDAWEILRIMRRIISDEEGDVLQGLGVSHNIAVLYSETGVSIPIQPGQGLLLFFFFFFFF